MKRFALVAIALVLAAMAFHLSTRLPSDDDMIITWRTHRQAFEQLRKMIEADGQNMYIGAGGVYWFASAESVGVSELRRNQYRALLSHIGASSISGNPMHSDRVAFTRHALLQFPTAPIKSYIYATYMPGNVTETTTDLYSFQPGDHRKVCRPLEGKWYVCLDYED